MAPPESSSLARRLAAWGLSALSSRRTPFAVFLASLVLTVWAWRTVVRAEEAVARLNLQKQAGVIEHRIADRLSDCETALLGGVGLFATSGEVSRTSWRDFVGALRPEVKLAGVQGVGFTLRIPAADLPAHIAQVRAEGFPQYAVFPPDPRPEYNSIIYLEPFRDRNLRAFGYDMATESVRRQAMERARDEGSTAMTGRVTLVQEIPGQVMQHGFLIYVPVYASGLPRATVAERRARLRGFVYSPLRAGDFFDSLFFLQRTGLGLEVHAGSIPGPDSLLYSSVTQPKSEPLPPGFQPRFVETIPVTLLGQRWTLVFQSLPAFEAAHGHATSSLILALGLVSGLSASGLLFAQGSRNRNLSRLALLSAELQKTQAELEVRVQERTAELARVSAHYQLLHTVASDGIHVLDPQGFLTEFSESFRRMLGYTTDELAGMNLTRWDAQIPKDELVSRIQELILRPAVFESVHRRKDGTEFPVEINARGVEIGGRSFLYASARDITERKQAEESLRHAQMFLDSIIEHSPNAMWVADRQGNLVRMNQACRQNLRLRDDEVIGQYNIFRDNIVEAQGFMPQVKAVFAQGATARFVLSYDTAAVAGLSLGQTTAAVLDVNISPILDSHGKVVNAIIQHVDITDRMREHRKIEELLAQTESDARTKGELLREVNHRVTNNLAAVLGLLAHEKEHAEGNARSLVAPVLDRLQQRIRGLLQVHRMLAQSAWTPMRLDKLSDEIIRAALSAATDRQQAKVTIRPSALKVSPRQAGGLALVLNELTTNTVKYAGQASPAVAIELQTESEQEWTTIRYRDNGPGYSADVLENQRAGVGLKLIREVVTKTLRGSLDLSNQQGAVAVLRIQLEDENRT